MKREATTVHGTVAYETVTCDSCGNEVAKEDAERFVIGEVKSERATCGAYQIRFTHHREGWACPYCRDDPAGYPTRFAFMRWLKSLSETEAIAFAMLCMLLTFTVILGVDLLL